jgi:hypothetical protein
MRDLERVLRTEHGLTDLPPLELPRAISDDRKTIVGWTRFVSQGDISRNTAWAIFLDKPLVPFATALDGDFNNDGVIDTADYVVWRNGLGATYSPDDYGSWRANFGRSTGATAAVAERSGDTIQQIPEPSAVVLVACALGPTILGRRKRLRTRP